MAKKKTAKKVTQGGRRVGSGKPSLFRGKSASSVDPMYGNVPKPISVSLTWGALDIAEAKTKRLRVSRNEFIEGLIRKYGRGITREDIEAEAAKA